MPRIVTRRWELLDDDTWLVMATTGIVTRPNRVLDIGLAVVLVVVSVSAYFVAGPPNAHAATVRTTTATRGIVLSSVQASGNVQPAQAYSVGFQASGTVTDVDVKVGDTVTKGQALAHVDPTMAAASLASARASLASAQAQLALTEQVETPTQRAQAAASVSSAQQQLAAAQTSLTGAQNTASIDATQLQQAFTDAQSKLENDQAAHASASQIAQDQSALTQAQNAVAPGENKDQQAIAQAQDQLSSAQASLNSTLAQNAANSQLLPSSLAAAQASVAQAQAQYASAAQAFGYTTLQAPTDGVVTAINGVVGQTVSAGGVSASPSSTTSGSSSGGSTGASSGASSGGSSSSGASSSSSSSSAFLTITNVNSLSVKAGFAETDATKLKVGQPAVISFSALPNVQASGIVDEVDVNSTLVSNVVTYFATVSLTAVPAGVKPGMTASVTVTIDRREGVLTLTSAAVRGSGSSGTVTVVNGKTQTTQTVGVGLRGDTLTEIMSGLNAGQTVALPSSTLSGVSSQVSSNAGRFLTGGGLGGGGLGGGGGGGGGRTGTRTGG